MKPVGQLSCSAFDFCRGFRSVLGSHRTPGRRGNNLYLDESGTATFNDGDRVFALGGVAMHEEDVPTYVDDANALKRRFFGREDITFHEPAMRRHTDWFSFGGDATVQAEFDAAFRRLVEKTPFTLIGVIVRKDLFKQSFVDTGCDPYLPPVIYHLAIMLALERYVDFLASAKERRMGRLHLESIGAQEDAQHQAACADLQLHGTQFVPQRTFQSWVEPGCRFSPKRGSDPAELADLVARELFEWGCSDCKQDPPYWSVVGAKVYLRADGHGGKFGIKVFPYGEVDSLEPAVMAHRVRCGATPRY